MTREIRGLNFKETSPS